MMNLLMLCSKHSFIYAMTVVRDCDGFIYMREWMGGLACGGYDPIVAKITFPRDVNSKNNEPHSLHSDWDTFRKSV